jgi:8-oxo-dGTP pyrophosphatase MutT (NUDIX family)/phosphohistidine phosphatase SixA
VIGPPIRAAGGVLWRHAADARRAIEVAVIHRPRYDDWSLPKGKVASGESELEAAVREVLEETGFHVRVGRPLGVTRYTKETVNGPRQKVVRWWGMQAEGGGFSPTREVDELVWLSPDRAAAQLTRATDIEVLERFAAVPGPTRTVLLVRHASAGARGSWRGDDRDRPLDECGVAQADELVRMLSRFEVGRIVSADLRRCTETVALLAEAFGRSIEPAPVVSEAGYPGNEDEAMALVRELGDAEHDAVVCSQGEVIPDLVRRLATADGLSLDGPIRAAKGSTWALSLDLDGSLVSVEHFVAPRPRESCADLD